MTELEPFNEGATCPKCGHDDISTRYCKDRRPVELCWPYVTGEHLHRTCKRCGFEWLEGCLDAEDSNDPH